MTIKNSEDSEWAIPVPKCTVCGYEDKEDVTMVRMVEPTGEFGELKPICYGCLDKYEEAAREAAYEAGEDL